MVQIFRYIYFFFFDIFNNSKISAKFVSHRAKLGTSINVGYLTAIDSGCEIGNYTSIGRNVNITRTKIGNYTSIGNNVSIGQGEHDMSKISLKAMFYGADGYETLTPGICEIGHDVWVGAHAIILRGVKIGNGAVIGAGAVVTKNVDDFEVVVGVPAKKLKDRFNNEKKIKILKTEWWLKKPEDAKNIFIELENL